MLLIDASVWVALERSQDRYREAARSLVLDSDAEIAALDLTLYEVANVAVLKIGQPERARFLAELLLGRCERLLRVDIAMIDSAAQVAAEHGLTAYDAAYVAAARRYGMTLVSGDLRDLVEKGLAITPDAALYP